MKKCFIRKPIEIEELITQVNKKMGSLPSNITAQRRSLSNIRRINQKVEN